MPDNYEAHFRAIPWCAAILADPQFQAQTPEYRNLSANKPSSEDTFFARTLNTPDTIGALTGLYRVPTPADAPHVTEGRWLFDVRGGVNGYPDTAHGGFIATILDEIIGFLIMVDADWRARVGIDEARNFFTAYLNVVYKAQMGTPGVYMAVARIERVEGSKVWLKAEIVDGEGRVYATADSLYVRPKAKI